MTLRSPAPTLKEIKDMSLEELFRELSRVQVAINRINVQMGILRGRQEGKVDTEKALHRHIKAKNHLVGELSARYVEEDDARRAVLFRLAASAAVHAKALVQADPDTEEWTRAWTNLNEALTVLEAL
jgi:hypothetical protein